MEVNRRRREERRKGRKWKGGKEGKGIGRKGRKGKGWEEREEGNREWEGKGKGKRCGEGIVCLYSRLLLGVIFYIITFDYELCVMINSTPAVAVIFMPENGVMVCA
ncbi:hypothetical protein K440DRAFT_367235 [Wilcoxina mikolae CBS 423.85]|nr:hypothetical protein K440DRAFT_367235 [Wilcoxina mikolae CBS 423.85]